MPIVAECPHCSFRRPVPSEFAGRAVRCGNPDCRQTFTIGGAAVPPPRPSPPPRPAPPPADPDLPHIPAEAEVVEAEPLEAEVVEASPVREVVWSADADLPPPPPRPGGRAAAAAAPPRKPARVEVERDEPEPEPEDDEPIVRRKRKKKSRLSPAVVLIGLVSALVIGIGAIALLSYRKGTESDDLLAKTAKEQYEKQDYGQAAKTYGQLAEKKPGSDGDEYRFFADLSGTQVGVRSVSTRENPKAALERYKEFTTTWKGKPFVKPAEQGVEVFDMGKKLGEDVAGYAGDRVKEFVKDRSKGKELEAADEAVKTGRELVKQIDPYRPKELPPPDALGKEFDRVAGLIGQERHRLGVVGRVRQLLADPTDPNIANAKVILAAERLAADPEAAGLVLAAEGDFLRRVRFDPESTPPPPLAADGGAASVLFVAPVGPTKSAAGGPGEAGGVFVAVARGVLYALDEVTGDLLWAARVGPAVYDPPALARADGGPGPPDLAVVASDVAGAPAVTGHDLRTGKPLWRQPLPAAPAGPAAVLRNRAFVPLRGPEGTVHVFDLPTGTRVGRMTLGQPAGPVVGRPGTSLVYAAGESRRVFVFDVDAGRCVRVLPTGHPAGTLRSAPVFLGPPGEDPGPDRWLLVSQADGPTKMRLRAFPLGPTPPAADGPPPADPVKADVDLEVEGWAWFPPATDGERLAFVTDAAQLRLFGLNQVGSRDAPVFRLPSPDLPKPADSAPVPGLVVPAEDGAFWVLTNGTLQKFRLALKPDRGLEAVTLGPPVAVGVPTQPAQLGPRRETACFIVRSASGSGCRAVAVGLADGEPRWQRQLGLVAAAAPAPAGGGLLLGGEDGAAFLVPAAGLAGGGVTRSAPGWVAAGPPEGVSGPTAVAVSLDGKTAFTITPTAGAAVPQFAVRRFVDGKLDHRGAVAAPGALAGPPAVVAGALLVPVSDGFVYRFEPGDGRLKPDTLTLGPPWWADRKTADPVGHVVPIGDDAFVTADGGRGVVRWVWPAGGGHSEGGAAWQLKERVAAAPAVVPGGPNQPARLLVADVTGGVWLYPADRGGDPTRRWTPGRTADLPGGRIGGIAVGAGPGGKPLAVYAADGRRLVALDPDKDAPAWVGPAADEAGTVVGLPRAVAGGRWLVTELGGRVKVLDGATGKPAVEQEVGLPGAVPAAAGVPAGGRVVVPLSDGSAAVVELPGLGDPEPKAPSKGEEKE